MKNWHYVFGKLRITFIAQDKKRTKKIFKVNEGIVWYLRVTLAKKKKETKRRSFLKATILARKKARLKEKHLLLQRIIYNVCLAFAKYA